MEDGAKERVPLFLEGVREMLVRSSEQDMPSENESSEEGSTAGTSSKNDTLALKEFYDQWAEGNLSGDRLHAVNHKFGNLDGNGLAWWQCFEDALGPDLRAEMLAADVLAKPSGRGSKAMAMLKQEKKDDGELRKKTPRSTIPLFLHALKHPEIVFPSQKDQHGENKLVGGSDSDGMAWTFIFDCSVDCSGTVADDVAERRARNLMFEMDHVRSELQRELNVKDEGGWDGWRFGAECTVEQPRTASDAEMTELQVSQRLVESRLSSTDTPHEYFRDDELGIAEGAPPAAESDSGSDNLAMRLAATKILKGLGLALKEEKEDGHILVIKDDPVQGSPAAQQHVRAGWHLVEIQTRKKKAWVAADLLSSGNSPVKRLSEVLQGCMRDIDVRFVFQIPPGLVFAKEEAGSKGWTVAKVEKGSMADLKGIKEMWNLVVIRMTADGDNKQYAAPALAPVADDQTKAVAGGQAGEQTVDAADADKPVLDQFTKEGTDAAGNIAVVIDDEPGDEIAEIDDENSASAHALGSEPTMKRINIDLVNPETNWRADVLAGVKSTLRAREREENNQVTPTDSTDDNAWLIKLEKQKTARLKQEVAAFDTDPDKLTRKQAWHMIYSLDKPGDDECVFFYFLSSCVQFMLIPPPARQVHPAQVSIAAECAEGSFAYGRDVW